MKAFYFAREDRKLRYNDNRSIIVGETHTVDCIPLVCKRGLHASTRLIDALLYAPGNILYHVELSGDLDKGNDKVAATKRTYLKEFDATELLREFARKQGLINIDKIKPYCSDKEYTLILDYLNTGNETIRKAAESAADSAARSAAWSAARSADSAARSARSAADAMLTEMVKDVTGWDI